MTNVIIMLLGAVVVMAILAVGGSIREKKKRKKLGLPLEEPEEVYVRPEGCCGKHERCEHDAEYFKNKLKPEYFDDEELDRFKGYPPNKYTIEEEQEFLEVLRTMLPSDVKGWILSLGQRGVTLPDNVRKEAHKILLDMKEK